MTNASHPASDREALSALFDGELAGDAARFALKRLDHDQDWRATCERWQLAGDALRGQAHALLSPSFPSRVRAAMRADAAAPAVAAPSHARRWGGVALVASAAAVALFLARMPVGGDVAAPQVAATANTATPAPVAPAPVVPPQPAPDAGVAELAAASVVATATTRVAQRERAPQRTRSASRPQRAVAVAASSPVVGEAMTSDTAVAGVTTSIGSASLAPSAPATPFDANAVRPWPRAVLPQYGKGGALVADYAAPSFYPFAPRVPETSPSTDAPADDRAQSAPPAP